MPVVNSELYFALKEAGAGEDKARAVAESVATYENRFVKIENDLAILKWIVGTNAVITLAVLTKLLIA